MLNLLSSKKTKTKSQKKESSEENLKRPKKKFQIPKTVAESIPYIYAYENGIFEIEPGVFSKSFKITDINFKVGSQDEQDRIFLAFGNFLNSFEKNATLQFTVCNHVIDEKEFKDKILLKLRGDKLDDYRKEYNDMLLDKIKEGNNKYSRDKYLTISVVATNIDAAMVTLSRLTDNINKSWKKISKENRPAPMTLVERLSVLYEIMRGNEQNFYQIAKVNGKKFDFDEMKKQRLTTKDLIGPSYMRFEKNYIEMDERFMRVCYLNNLPSFLTTNTFSDICEIPCTAVTSVTFQPTAQDENIKLLKNRSTNLNANIISMQKKASRGGYSPDLVSPKLQQESEDNKNLLDDLRKRDQKMYYVSVIIMLIADSEEELDRNTEMIKTMVRDTMCSVTVMNYLQEQAFALALPLGHAEKEFGTHFLKTECASVFLPFSVEELSGSGQYYGVNPISNNIISYDRTAGKNGNGMILGVPGSGKSFAAKMLVIAIALGTDDDIIIVDPEREYMPIVTELGGEVVKIAPGNGVYINPLDMDLKYAEDDEGGRDPLSLKSDYICSLFEIISRARYGLMPNEVAIIDRCTRIVYQDYLKSMENYDGTCNRNASPILEDLYEILMQQPDPEAHNLATSLELYASGSQNAFSARTNVDLNNRIVAYDIKDIGNTMSTLGLQVCLNDIWNRTIENGTQGKRTWVFIDEAHLLIRKETSGSFLESIYKRARKWGGILTSMTQNVEDFLKSANGTGILNNACEFVIMLEQSPYDRLELGSMYNISDELLEYITNANPGSGLIKAGQTIVPFENDYPEGTKLYNLITTKAGERIINK